MVQGQVELLAMMEILQGRVVATEAGQYSGRGKG